MTIMLAFIGSSERGQRFAGDQARIMSAAHQCRKRKRGGNSGKGL